MEQEPVHTESEGPAAAADRVADPAKRLYNSLPTASTAAKGAALLYLATLIIWAIVRHSYISQIVADLATKPDVAAKLSTFLLYLALNLAFLVLSLTIPCLWLLKFFAFHRAFVKRMAITPSTGAFLDNSDVSGLFMSLVYPYLGSWLLASANYAQMDLSRCYLLLLPAYLVLQDYLRFCSVTTRHIFNSLSRVSSTSKVALACFFLLECFLTMWIPLITSLHFEDAYASVYTPAKGANRNSSCEPTMWTWNLNLRLCEEAKVRERKEANVKLIVQVVQHIWMGLAASINAVTLVGVGKSYPFVSMCTVVPANASLLKRCITSAVFTFLAVLCHFIVLGFGVPGLEYWHMGDILIPLLQY